MMSFAPVRGAVVALAAFILGGCGLALGEGSIATEPPPVTASGPSEGPAPRLGDPRSVTTTTTFDPFSPPGLPTTSEPAPDEVPSTDLDVVVFEPLDEEAIPVCAAVTEISNAVRGTSGIDDYIAVVDRTLVLMRDLGQIAPPSLGGDFATFDVVGTEALAEMRVAETQVERRAILDRDYANLVEGPESSRIFAWASSRCRVPGPG